MRNEEGAIILASPGRSMEVTKVHAQSELNRLKEMGHEVEWAEDMLKAVMNNFKLWEWLEDTFPMETLAEAHDVLYLLEDIGESNNVTLKQLLTQIRYITDK